MLMPSKPVPELRLGTLAHGTFELGADAGRAGTLVLFYRGLHCPICTKQLAEIEAHLDALSERGVEVVAVSADPEDRARKMHEKAGLKRLRLAYGLSLDAARDGWGLYISSAREGSEEPPLFNEPGLFYVNPDGTLYFAWVQSAPFARPATEDVLGGIDFVLDKGYPPRGMYEGPLDRAA